jgi:hypothetical protein
MAEVADTRDRVIAFRIKEPKAEVLDNQATSSRIVNVRSGNQLARKVILDFIAGKLVYLNPGDRHRDPTLSE